MVPRPGQSGEINGPYSRTEPGRIMASVDDRGNGVRVVECNEGCAIFIGNKFHIDDYHFHILHKAKL